MKIKLIITVRLTHKTPKLSSYNNQSIEANQLTGFHMMATLAFNELRPLILLTILLSHKETN